VLLVPNEEGIKIAEKPCARLCLGVQVPALPAQCDIALGAAVVHCLLA
jgi:hypothetical protein